MSNYVNVIVLYGHEESERGAKSPVRRLVALLKAAGYGSLTRNKQVPRMLTGSIRNLDICRLNAWMHGIKWAEPQNVQILYRDENMERWAAPPWTGEAFATLAPSLMSTARTGQAKAISSLADSIRSLEILKREIEDIGREEPDA